MISSKNRRGAALVFTAVMSTLLIGFAALAIDVSVLYNTRGELQRAADAAALAAASRLAAYGDGDPLELARQTAAQFAYENKAFREGTEIDPAVDVEFGRAVLDLNTGKFSFVPTATMPDAVRVRVRRTADSPTGPVGLFFARVFGFNEANIAAEATALLRPRDIAIVADLSSSHTDDSELRHYRMTDINLWDVWAALPGGLTEGDPGYLPQYAGPDWGTNMNAFGTLDVDRRYDPRYDDGLFYMPFRQSCSEPTLEQMLANQGYSSQEIDVLMAGERRESTTAWRNRVKVALGIATWSSGIPGGRWQSEGWDPGDRDSTADNNEVEEVVDYPYNNGTWQQYIDYVASTNNTMYDANRDFQYRYGPKTFVNFLLEEKEKHSDTPELAYVPVQPMQGVKDSVDYMMSRIIELEANDQASLEVYASEARHEVDLTTDVRRVSRRLKEMQAGHYDSNTNMAGGMRLGIDELTGPHGRGGTVKMMVVLTDGIPNWPNSRRAPREALDAAEEAAGFGIRIYTVSVGVAADQNLMADIAEIGHGEHFHAEGSIGEYSAQLDEILKDLGGKRPVMLIQ